MPITLIRVELPHTGEERFLGWSSIVDAPVTYGMTEEELRAHIRFENGNEGMRDLDARLARCRAKGTSSLMEPDVESVIIANRAGPGEVELTLPEIVHQYCVECTE